MQNIGIRYLVPAILAAIMPAPLLASDALTSTTDKMNEATTEQKFGFSTGSFVVAPIPFKNPVIGAGLALGGAYLFQSDEESNTSIIGLGALASENGTQGYALTGSFAWDQNTWQLSATLADAALKYDLFVNGTPVPLDQSGSFLKLELLYGVSPELSFGGNFRYLDTSIARASGGALPIELGADSDLEIANLGFVTKWDTRDDSLYPLTGELLDFEVLYGDVLNSASSRTYGKSFANFSLYRSLQDSTVLASRVSLCASSEDAPFFDQCSLGGTDAFRGFSATQYIDTHSASAQIEIRHQLSDRFRGVAFAGAGLVGPDFGNLSDGGTHVAGGVGLRFKLSKKFDADFSVDWTYNDEDTDLVYIYVGQRF